MGARGQDRLTESIIGSLKINDVYMKRVFETAECEEVRRRDTKSTRTK